MANSKLPLFVHIAYDSMSDYQSATVSATPQEIYEACADGRSVFAVIHANDPSVISSDVPFESTICPLVGAGFADERYTAIFSFYFYGQQQYVRLDETGLNVVWAFDYRGGK